MKKPVRLIVAGAGLAALAFAARHLDVHALMASIRHVDPLLGLAAALVMIAAKLGAKIVRSQILLAAAGTPPAWRTTARLLAASHAAGQLAWGPLGFTVRTLALRDGGMPLKAIARVHVAERIAEALGIAAIAAVVLVIEPGAIIHSWLGRILIAVLALIVLAAIAIAASRRLRARLSAHAGTGGALARASAWAFASSVADVGVLLLAAAGMHVAVPLPAALLAFLAMSGVCALPLTPAQLGVQESAIVVAFATAGIAAPQALACALAYRAAHIVPLMFVGVPALAVTAMSRKRGEPEIAPSASLA
jgi:uncharacterized membrane protein YbhN (UPF0104 family)